MPLVHQCARPLADCNGFSFALKGDAGVFERGQKARITARIIAARIGNLCRRGHADYGGEACKHNKHPHRLIVQIGAAVLPNRFVGPSTPESSYERLHASGQ